MNKLMKTAFRKRTLLPMILCLASCNGGTLSHSCNYNDMILQVEISQYNEYYPLWLLGIKTKTKYEVEKELYIYIAQRFLTVETKKYNCNLEQKIDVSLTREIRDGFTLDIVSSKVVSTLSSTLKDLFTTNTYDSSYYYGIFKMDYAFTDKLTVKELPSSNNCVISYSLSFSSPDSEYLQIDNWERVEDSYENVNGVYWTKLDNVYSHSSYLNCFVDSGQIHFEPRLSKY